MKTKTKQGRKQRRALANAPLHRKHRLLSASLDKPLRAKFKRRNLTLKRGDKVRVLCGKFKGKEGEVMNINLGAMKVYVDKVVSKKKDGTDVLKPVPPSNLMIIDIDLRDKKRQAVLQRKVSKTVVEQEAKREEDRLKMQEEERKTKEAEKKAEEKAKKEEKEKKEEEEAEKTGKRKPKIKVSEKGIDDKTKKDWISGK